MRGAKIKERIGINNLKGLAAIIKCFGGIALGFGTLFLGWAACTKAHEIYEVVSVVQGLEGAIQTIQKLDINSNKVLTRIDETTQSMQKLTTETNKILSRIEKQNGVIALTLANEFYSSEPDDASKFKLIQLMQRITIESNKYTDSFQAASNQKTSVITQSRMNENKAKNNEQINKIINKLTLMKKREDKINYLSSVIEKFLNSDDASP